MIRSRIKITGNIIAVLEHVGTRQRRLIRGKNIITYSGDLYYAKRAAYEVPDYDFATIGIMQLGKGTSAPTKSDTGLEVRIAGSAKALADYYPCTDDQDVRNTGAGIYTVTYKFVYDTAEVVETGIAECIIGSDSAEVPDALLMHGLFDEVFDKSDRHTLTIFGNHTFEGI